MNKKKSPPSLVFDVVVIGGGHAGVEACMITSSMKAKTLLITANEKRIAAMDCNPAMGGLAKGTVIREIDALGGVMGAVTDKTALQFKLLNTSKGPGV